MSSSLRVSKSKEKLLRCSVEDKEEYSSGPNEKCG
jgi:hypothetical protein